MACASVTRHLGELHGEGNGMGAVPNQVGRASRRASPCSPFRISSVEAHAPTLGLDVPQDPARVEQGSRTDARLRGARRASSRTSSSRRPGSRHCCCPAACAAPRHPSEIMGTPSDSIVTVRKFFTCRFRSFSTAGSSVGPSTPQFQLRLSSAPSRLSSPFASLCFRS